jgi:hypothetical protein
MKFWRELCNWWENKKDNKENPKEKVNYSRNSLYIFNIFAVSILLFVLYLIIPDIFNSNIHDNMKNTILLICLVGFIILWGFVSLVSSFKEYSKEFGLLLIFILLNYLLFLFKDSWLKLGISIILVIVLIKCIFSKSVNDTWTLSKARGWFTLLLMLFVFFAGLLIINEVYGYQPTSAYLNINGNMQNRYEFNEKGNLKCSSFRGDLIMAGMKVNCKVIPSLKEVYYANITFTDNLGNERTEENKNLSFIAQPNIYKVYFYISGIDQKNNPINISTAYPYTFYTPEEFKARQEGFATYLLGLLGLIFLTIPLMINQFRELLKD